MLSDSRKPPYRDLKTQKEKMPYYMKEDLKKIYLSSIRRADEWSYKELESYIDSMTDGNYLYGAIILPYQLGVKNGFISKRKVEDVFRSNEENIEILRAVIRCLYVVIYIENRFNSWNILKDRLATA